MTETAIQETSGVVNKLADAYPAYAVIVIVLIGVGIILFCMQRMQNQFLCKIQERSEEQLDKTIRFIGNYAAMMQSDTDAVRELSKAVTDLNRDCRAKFQSIQCTSPEERQAALDEMESETSD